MRPSNPPRSGQAPAPSGGRRGDALVRLRVGFILIAMVLSVFAARLVQLQGIDPHAYAEMAAREGSVTVVLPATRGEILDRYGAPLATSVEGMMVVADPKLTIGHAAPLATLLSRRLDVDYFATLTALRKKGSRFEYIARRVPATPALAVVAEADRRGLDGLSTRIDPVRDYPGGDVAANLIGFMGTDEPLGGLERTFDARLAGTDGLASYEVSGRTKIPLGDHTITPATNGTDLHLTIDQDLQWYSQRVLRQAVEDANGESGTAVVMDDATGEVLAFADYPSFDAQQPLESRQRDLGSRGISDVFEPGSVEKILTMASLLDADKVTPRTRLLVPGELSRQDRPIHDWFEHGLLRLTLTGVLAKSSNIGTVLATDRLTPARLRSYLTGFGLGTPTNVGMRGEASGIIPEGATLTSQTKDRMSFGQSMSVNALQMTAAINAVANDGVYVSPSLIRGRATTDDGLDVGTDTRVTRRVVSAKAAHQTARMMERVLDPDVGLAPIAAVPDYRVAGKTGTAQRVGKDCGCYDGTFTVSFGGFAPADDPRFTVYVVVQNPRNGGGGGQIGGPVFAKIMSYALRRYGVPPTGTAPSQLPVEWSR